MVSLVLALAAASASASEIRSLTADDDRPFVYAIARGGTGMPDTLWWVDVASESVVTRLPVGVNVSDVSLSAGEGRLYVTNHGEPVTRVVDLTTRTELAPLALGTDVYKLNAGRPGRIYTEESSQWVNLRGIDDASGAVVAGAYPLREGDGAVDPTGHWYYHCDNDISDAHITRYDVSADAFTKAGTSAEHAYGTRNLVMAGDGSRLFWSGYVYDAALTEKRKLGEEIYATSLHGEIAFGATRAINSVNGVVLATLPVSSTVRAVSGDQGKLFTYDPIGGRLVVTPMSAIAPSPAAVQNPVPAIGTTVMLPLTTLAWDTSPAATSYRVYFGSDSAAVATSDVGSPLLLGTVASPSIALGVTLVAGTRYWWRVDVVGFAGTTPGPIWRFDVAPVIASPTALVLRSVTGVPAPVTAALALGAPSATPWTVTSSAPWLSLDHASGTAPDTLRVTATGNALAPGTYADTLRFTSGTSTFTVPVGLELVPLRLSRMVTDYDRPFVYALHPGSGEFDDAFLLFVSTAGGQVTKVLPIGRNPTDMALNAAEGRLYVTNHGQPVTRVVDLVTQSELAPLALGTDVFTVNAGRSGRLYTEGYGPSIPLRAIDSATGTVVSTAYPTYAGDGATDPTGHWYYHGDSDASNARITRYDVSADGFTPSGTSPVHPYASRNLVISGDGSRLFWRGYAYDSALVERSYVGEDICAALLHGEVAFSAIHAINVVNGSLLAYLQVYSNVRAVSGDQTKLLTYNPDTHAIDVTPMTVFTPLPPVARNPVPVNGATVVLPLGALVWDGSSAATSYRVYFGSDSAAVATADAGSPLLLGTVTSPSIAPGALAFGARYWWRADAVGFAGTTTGPVWRFDVTPIVVAPNALALRTLTSGPPLTVPVVITAPSPTGWSVVKSAAWLSVDHASGTTPDTLRVTATTGALTAGTYADTLRFTSGTSTFRVPVSFQLTALVVTKMVADYERPFVYALHPGSGTADDAFLLFVSTASGQVTKLLPIGRNPTDMALNAGEGRLYVTNYGQPVTRVVDVATQSELAPLALGPDVYNVNAGRPGRICVEGRDQWCDPRVIDTSTGAALATVPFVFPGDAVTDPIGHWYYHCNANFSDARITRYDVSADGFTTSATSPIHPYGARNLVISGDGSRLFWSGYVFDAALADKGYTIEEIFATSLHGEVAFSPTRAINVANGAVLATFGDASTVRAVSGDQTKLLSYYPFTHTIVTTPMSSIAPLPPVGLNPVPANRTAVVLPLTTLAWDVSPVATGYRVYFGSDSAAVATAGTGSPLLLGTVTSPSIALDAPLALGARYWWRVDVVGFTGTTAGAAWWFDVAPIVVAPNALTLRTVTGAPPLTVPLALTMPLAAGWTVTRSASWLSVDHGAGTTPDTLRVTATGGTLAAGTYADTLRFTSGPRTFTVPISLQVIQMTVTQMVTDYERPFVYALHPGSGRFDDAYLLFVSTASGQVTKVLPIGRNPTDMTLSPGEGRLYVTNHVQPVTRVVDLATQAELAPLALGTDVYKLNAGRPGRIYTEGFNQFVSLRAMNSATGAVVSTVSPIDEGDGALDPTGHWYYHCEDNNSNAHITRYDVSADAFVTSGTSAVHSFGTRNLVIAGDGTRLFWSGYAYDAALTEQGHLGEEIYATSLHGEIAFGATHAIDAATGAVVATLPVSSTVRAVSGDQSKLLTYNPATHAIGVTPMSTVALLPPRGLVPVPANGATVVRPLTTLAWDVSPVATGYRVYFGSDSAAVATADTGSPLLLGTVTSLSIPLGVALATGARYWWRVDVVGNAATTVGPAWRFDVAPVVVDPNALAFRSVPGGAAVHVHLLLSAPSGSLPYAVSRTSAWLSLGRTSGSTPDTLAVTVTIGTLAAGIYADTLRFTSGASTFTVPVRLELVPMVVTQMITDYERPFIYALHPGSGQSDDALLLFLSTATGQVTKLLPIGTNPTDMALSVAEGRLYVTNYGQPVTRVVDLATQSELAPLALGTDVYKVNAGRSGRVYTEGFNQSVYLTMFDSHTGASLWRTLVREGDGATDPAGRWYYHCENNISNAHITLYYLGNEAPNEFSTSTEHPYGSRNLVLAPDGGTLFWRGYVYGPLLDERRNLGEEIVATSQHGEVAFGTSHLFDAVTGEVLGPLPSGTVRAISPDQRTLYTFDATSHTIVGTHVDVTTPTALAFVRADTGPGWVRIVWHADTWAGPAVVERRETGAWAVIGAATADASGTLTFEDHSVVPGRTYSYRVTAGAAAFGETSVTAAAARFALAGVAPNPVAAGARPVIHFALAESGRARIELLDVQGRTVWERAWGAPEPGEHSVTVDGARLAPGVYFVRLVQGHASAHSRFAVVR